ncbi:hypothetical protein [Salinisphaera sp.]|uniref:hypothetical protein n=1 Tax=Salinisphaera sp. TaxID=1914330 RepID=UPI003C7AD45D
MISSAEAWVGRPLTPMSVAGVARRSTRRDVAYVGAADAAYAGAAAAPAYAAAPVATAALVASLPTGCTPQGAVFVCSGRTYKPMMQGSTVVYEVQ